MRFDVTQRRLVLLVLSAAALGLSCSNKSSPPPAATDGCVQPDTGLPTDVFCTGLYATHDGTVSPDVLPYTPGVTLWSDGAEKRRFLYLPPSTTIDTSNLDTWKFPVGTKAWKEFRVDGVLVETRLFWKRTPTSWDSGTYIWDATGATATLNTAPKGVILPSGYEIPTQKDARLSARIFR